MCNTHCLSVCSFVAKKEHISVDYQSHSRYSEWYRCVVAITITLKKSFKLFTLMGKCFCLCSSMYNNIRQSIQHQTNAKIRFDEAFMLLHTFSFRTIHNIDRINNGQSMKVKCIDNSVVHFTRSLSDTVL